MHKTQVKPIPSSVVITFDGKKISLPASIRKKVDHYWAELSKGKSTLFNGEVFTVTSVTEHGSILEVTLAETDYAHYQYGQQVSLGPHAVHLIHPAALVISSDNRLIFGAMGVHTSLPGVIQFCGGGIDHGDVTGGAVNIEHNISKELAEELGINIAHTALTPTYLAIGGETGKITIVYLVHLNQTAAEFTKNYRTFTDKLVRQGEKPEFASIFCLKNDEETIENFIADNASRINEYVAETLRKVHVDMLQ